MAIVKVNKEKKEARNAERENLGARIEKPVSAESMARLAQIMTDSPTLKKLHGTEWEIRALRPGTQWLIAEEACKIIKKENMSSGDVLKEFATNMQSVCRVLALALSNSKEKIYGDYYKKVYEELLWGDYNLGEWSMLLMEVLSLLDVNFFFANTAVIQTIRTKALDRKMTMKELKQLGLAPNGAK